MGIGGFGAEGEWDCGDRFGDFNVEFGVRNYGIGLLIRRIYIDMEDSENLSDVHGSLWESDNKFQHEWRQGFKDSMQIENRIKIL